MGFTRSDIDVPLYPIKCGDEAMEVVRIDDLPHPLNEEFGRWLIGATIARIGYAYVTDYLVWRGGRTERERESIRRGVIEQRTDRQDALMRSAPVAYWRDPATLDAVLRHGYTTGDERRYPNINFDRHKELNLFVPRMWSSPDFLPVEKIIALVLFKPHEDDLRIIVERYGFDRVEAVRIAIGAEWDIDARASVKKLIERLGKLAKGAEGCGKNHDSDDG